MEITLIYVLLALSAACLALCAFLVLKMKTVLYLLEQPVIKKMGPQLKLKPVKIDELLAEKNRQQQQLQQSHSQGPSQSHRPHQQGPQAPGQNGGRPPQSGRGDRPDFDRGGSDRNRDRGPRQDRPEGDRDRNRDRERFRDRDRNRDRFQSGDRRPPRENNEPRDSASPPPVENHRPEFIPQAPAPQPLSHAESMAPLAPRRPLPSMVETTSSAPQPIKTAPESEPSMEGLFVGGDGDMQHGRRNQVKKKPRFEVNEEEVKVASEG